MSYNEKDIAILNDIEHVRQRFNMYIPNASKEGLHHLIFEIVDNSLDEISEGYGDKIIVSLHKDNSISVEDFGRGIPCGIHPTEKIPTLDVVLTKLKAGGKFSKTGYKNASSLAGLFGVGSSVVSALSKSLRAIVHREGKEYFREYQQGKVIGDPNNLEIKDVKQKQTGTKISFLPDDEIFKVIKYDPHIICHRLKELSYLFPKIEYQFINERDNKQKEIFCSEKGLSDYILDICEDKEDLFPKDPIVFSGKSGNTETEVVILYSSEIGETCLSFCNGIYTADGGTAISGFRKSFTRALNTFGRDSKLISEKETNLTGDDLRDGINYIISVKVKEPQFAGQTKAKLNNPEVEGEVGEIVYPQALEYFKNNAKVADKIITAALATRKARTAARKQQEITRRKSIFGKTTLPGKLIDCASEKQEDTELYLVEGLSAVGTARQARNANFQALLPLKGKIISSEKQTLEKIMANQEIQDIVAAIGIPIENLGAEDIDCSKLRYGKIIFLFDADEDGGHITTLAMAFFLRYARPLFENGMIYSVDAPLYVVLTKTKRIYCQDDKEMTEMLRRHPGAMITRLKGHGESETSELEETCMNPETRKLFKIELSDFSESNKLVRMFMGTKTEDRKKLLFGDENGRTNQ